MGFFKRWETLVIEISCIFAACIKKQMDYYYASHTKTAANSIELTADLEEKPHLPNEGICIGSLIYRMAQQQ